jgi:hypothetical protein
MTMLADYKRGWAVGSKVVGGGGCDRSEANLWKHIRIWTDDFFKGPSNGRGIKKLWKRLANGELEATAGALDRSCPQSDVEAAKNLWPFMAPCWVTLGLPLIGASGGEVVGTRAPRRWAEEAHGYAKYRF